MIFSAQGVETSYIQAIGFGRSPIGVAQNEIGEPRIDVDQLHTGLRLEFLQLRFQLAPHKRMILHAGEALSFRDEGPHPDQPAARPRLHHPHDLCAFRIDR